MDPEPVRPNPEIQKKMREDWDSRARENAFYYIASSQRDWSAADFFASGEDVVREQILDDMSTVCQGRPPEKMRVLEIGCGAGRVTRALARVFGEVHGVDVSGEMIALGRKLLADCPNVYFHQNNGADLSVLGELQFDFAFSFIVFQHIPTKEVIENYVREVHRVLRPGSLFKFQVQGSSRALARPDDTWVGAPIPLSDAIGMAQRAGFELQRYKGVEEQYFWLWYLKPPQPPASGETLASEAGHLESSKVPLHARTAEQRDELTRELEKLQERYRLAESQAREAVQQLEEENRKKTEWAQALEQSLSTVENELQQCVKLLDDAEQRVIERTEWAQGLDRELERLRGWLASLYATLAYRLSARLGLVPKPPAGAHAPAESSQTEE